MSWYKYRGEYGKKLTKQADYIENIVKKEGEINYPDRIEYDTLNFVFKYWVRGEAIENHKLMREYAGGQVDIIAKERFKVSINRAPMGPGIHIDMGRLNVYSQSRNWHRPIEGIVESFRFENEQARAIAHNLTQYAISELEHTVNYRQQREEWLKSQKK